jgi:hypothetical protein
MQGDDSRRARVSTLPNHRTRDPNQTQILRATCGRADENGCNRYRYLGGLRELRTQSFSRTTRKIGEPSQEIHFVTGSSRICSGASKAMTYWQVNRLSIFSSEAWGSQWPCGLFRQPNPNHSLLYPRPHACITTSVRPSPRPCFTPPFTHLRPYHYHPNLTTAFNFYLPQDSQSTSTHIQLQPRVTPVSPPNLDMAPQKRSMTQVP